MGSLTRLVTPGCKVLTMNIFYGLQCGQSLLVRVGIPSCEPISSYRPRRKSVHPGRDDNNVPQCIIRTDNIVWGGTSGSELHLGKFSLFRAGHVPLLISFSSKRFEGNYWTAST